MADSSSSANIAAEEDVDLASIAPQEGIEGISVAVRVRPLNSRETKSGWRALPQYNAIAQLGSDGEPLQGSHAVFNVDRVFDEKSTTKELYSSVCSKVVSSAVNGINGTIFAYGQTSSGKTHTMQGGDGSVGVLQLAAEEIFNLIEASSQREYLLRVSFMEIYNENLRDLLSADGNTPVHIREDPKRGVYIECKEEVITGFADIEACLQRGEKFRVVGATAMNERSSRSHAIFRLTIESRSQNEHGEVTLTSAALNLVDLAGSESVRNTGATGQRAKEGGKINQSLLTLSRVIQQLGEGGGHVNFRDSKLTRLLQPMLQGNACMAMITCVTPAEQFSEETRSTLQFACRAKSVRLNPEINEVLDKDSQLKKLRREIAEMKEREKQFTASSSSAGAGGVDNSAEMVAAVAEKDRLASALVDMQAMVSKYETIIKAEMMTGESSGMLADGDDFLDESFGGGGGAGGRGVKRGGGDKRGKRQRETWCPGERGVPMPEFTNLAMSPSNSRLPNRRRLSGGSPPLDEMSGGGNDASLNNSSSSSASGGGGGGNDLQVPALEAMLEKRTEELTEREAEMEAMYNSLDAAEQDAAGARQELETLHEASSAEIAVLNQQLLVASAAAAAATAQEAPPIPAAASEALQSRVSELEADLLESTQLCQELETDQLDMLSETKAKAKVDAEAIRALESKLEEAFSAQTSTASAAVDTLTAELALAHEETAAKTAEVEAMTLDKELLNGDLEEVREKLAAAETETAAQASRFAETAQEQLTAAKDSATELESRVEELEAEAVEMNTLIAALEAANTELTELNGEGEARAAALEAEVSACKGELSTVASQLNEFKAAMERAAAEAEASFAAELATKDAELDAFAAAAASAQEALGGKVLEAQASLAAKEEELAAAVFTLQEVQKAATEAAAATAEIADATSTANGGAVQEAEEKVAAAETRSAELAAQVNALVQEKAATLGQLEEAEKKSSEADAEHGKEVEALSAELSSLADELMAKDETMSQAVAAAQSEFEAAKAAALEAESALAQVRQEHAEQHAEAASVAMVTEELEATKSEAAALKQQLGNDVRLKEASKQVEATAERNSVEASKLRGDLTARDAELKALRQHCEDVETEIRCLKETAVNALQAQHADDEANSSKKVTQQAAQIQILTSELALCKHKLGEAEQGYAKASGSFDKKYEKAQQELGGMQRKVAAFEEVSLKCRNLEQAMAATEARATTAREACTTAEKHSKAAADAADKASNEVEALRAKVEKLEGGSGGGVAAEMERLQASEQEMEMKTKALETDLKGSEARLKKTRQENEMLTEECGRVGDQLQELELALAAATEAADQAGGDSEYLAELEGRVGELTAELEVKSSVVAGLEDRVAALGFEVESRDDAAKQQGEAMMEMAQQCTALEEANMDMDTKLMAAERSAAVASEQHEELEEAKASHARAAEECDQLVVEMGQLASKLERKDDECGGLQRELGRLDATVTSVERELAAARASAATSSTASEASGALESALRETKASEAKLRSELTRTKEEARGKLKRASAEIEQRDARIAELDKVKFTKKLEDQFKKLVQYKADGKLEVKRLSAEIDALHAASSSSSTSLKGSTEAEKAALAGLRRQFEEEKERCGKLETKLRKFVAYTQTMESGASAAKRGARILRVALKVPEPQPSHQLDENGHAVAETADGKMAGVEDIPKLALDLCKRLSEAEDMAALASGLEADVSRLRTEKGDALDALAEAEGKLEGLRAKEADLVKQLEGGRQVVAELEARMGESEQSQGQNAQELSSTLRERVREVKFLENENLQLMLECKEVKKSAAAARAELEALQKQTAKRSSPGCLSLAPNAAPPSSAALANKRSSSPGSKENTSENLLTNSFSSKRRAGSSAQSVASTSLPAPLAAPGALGGHGVDPADENPAECKQS